MGITHRTQSNVPDEGVPAGAVKPSDWNMDHDIDGLLGALVSLAVAPNVVAYLDAGQNGATFPISDFVRTLVMNLADAPAFRAMLGVATIDSPAFTGAPTAPTQGAGDNSTKIATTAYADQAIAALVAAAPAALNTLNELATALGDDANFSTTVTNNLALKAPLNSPALTGTPLAPTQAPGANSTSIATTAFVTAAVSALSTTINTALALKATLASPTFTGTPAAPTPTAGDNTTKLATTAFVAAAIAAGGGSVLYSTAQSLTSPQQLQARSNIGVTAIGAATLGQIPGTTGSTQPAAGFVGELISAVGASTNFGASGAWMNVCSITVTPGVWDIESLCGFGGAGATTSSDWTSAISPNSASATGALGSAHERAPAGTDYAKSQSITRRRVAVAVNTTYYLIAAATFSGSTYGAGGDLQARRVS